MSVKPIFAAACIGFIIAGVAAADRPASEPTSAPASSPASSPASQPAADPAAVKILERLEQAEQKHPAIKGDVIYRVVSGLMGDREERSGYVAYRAATDEKPAGFRVHFDTISQNGGPKLKEVKDYAFNGQWLFIADHRNKLLRRVQVAAPGEKVEPLRLGKGPFPLPFGQKSDQVLRLFDVTTRPLDEGEPEGTDYLMLVPRPEHKRDMNFVKLEMWVSSETDLPVKIVSREQNRTVTTVIFGEMESKADIPDDLFNIAKPRGWQVQTERLEEADNLR